MKLLSWNDKISTFLGIWLLFCFKVNTFTSKIWNLVLPLEVKIVGNSESWYTINLVVQRWLLADVLHKMVEWVKTIILRFLVAHKKINSPNNFSENLIYHCSSSFPNVGSVMQRNKHKRYRGISIMTVFKNKLNPYNMYKIQLHKTSKYLRPICIDMFVEKWMFSCFHVFLTFLKITFRESMDVFSIRCFLLQNTRRAFHHPAFMDSCPTISHMFSALSTKWICPPSRKWGHEISPRLHLIVLVFAVNQEN